jgi:hypothetical protein
MKKRRKRFFLSVALYIVTLVAVAQQVGSNSPYGRYGYGLLSDPSIGASETMGGISYGLRRSQQVNPGNPASYSELDTLTFIFDIGVSGQYATYDDGGAKQDFYNGNLDYIAMQFPIMRKIGASIGLLPYSKVGYSFGQARSSSDITYSEIYNGSGGLSEIYGGIAYEPFKYLSLGVNIAYFFGNIEHNKQLPSIDNTTLARIATDKFSIRDIKYDFGIQLTYPIDRMQSVTVGLVYTPKINAEAPIYSYDQLLDANGNVKQILKSDTIPSQSFRFPNSFGLGATYSNQNWLVGVDGTYQAWKGMGYPSDLDGMDTDVRFNNRYRIGAGAEYVIDPFSRDFFRRIRFRGGFSFANSYNNVNVYNPINNSNLGTGGFKEYGINIGFGLPFRDTYTGRVSLLNLGFGYSLLQPDKDFMIKEEMFKITINMNINEFWFFKRQFE